MTRLSENDYDLVYLTPHSRRSHIRPYTTLPLTVCGREANLWYDSFFGTGSQDEFDKARSLQLCKYCQDRYFPEKVL